MKNSISKLYVAIKGLMKEEGQDLVEYALVVALIAFAATAGMKTLAANINSAFTTIGTNLTSYTS
jgi:pilus assembly protein Flp/PilA